MNAQNRRNMAKMRQMYNPDSGDLAVGANGQFIKVTWGEFAMLEMIADQQREIDELQAQVARLLNAVPSAGIVVEQSAETMRDCVALKIDSIG